MLTHRQLFLNHLAQTSSTPLMIEIEKAEGIYLYGPDDKKYIDLISGISVSNLGHRHPNVVNAIKEQVDKYMHLMVYGEYVQSPQTKLAKALTDNLPPQLNSCYFVNSGSEAVEGALKLAKRYTGRTEIISMHNAYHGSSHGALSIMGNEDFKTNYRPLLPNVRQINYNQPADLNLITTKTACVVVETIQGEAGAVISDEGYLKALRDRCTEVGALLILDEIQCGFGRTGSLFAFEQYNIVPDILLLAKGMGGGMPIGAFISSQPIMNCFTNNPVLGHITTFGGHPVSCAAALATLNTLLQENLITEVAEKEALIRNLLVHPKIKGIRGKGLLLAAEFDNYDTNKKIIDRCIELGVITDWFLFADNCLRIAPPLIITEQEIKQSCTIILQAINEVA